MLRAPLVLIITIQADHPILKVLIWAAIFMVFSSNSVLRAPSKIGNKKSNDV